LLWSPIDPPPPPPPPPPDSAMDNSWTAKNRAISRKTVDSEDAFVTAIFIDLFLELGEFFLWCEFEYIPKRIRNPYIKVL
jgi:hypothetical protein